MINGGRIITFQLNQKRRPEFRVQKVRQAIVHAINNEGIVQKIMKNTATVAGQQGPKGYAGYKESLVPRYDLKKAKALMKEAGFADGFEMHHDGPQQPLRQRRQDRRSHRRRCWARSVSRSI
jgi:peptide/nickel transport system substrate-binding protein